MSPVSADLTKNGLPYRTISLGKCAMTNLSHGYIFLAHDLGYIWPLCPSIVLYYHVRSVIACGPTYAPQSRLKPGCMGSHTCLWPSVVSNHTVHATDDLPSTIRLAKRPHHARAKDERRKAPLRQVLRNTLMKPNWLRVDKCLIANIFVLMFFAFYLFNSFDQNYRL